MNRNGHPNVTRPLRDMPVQEQDVNTMQIKPHPHDKKLKEFAALWLRGPIPADLMADLADILEDLLVATLNTP